MSIDISFVVPAHNSARVLTATVERIRAWAGDRSVEIVVVENGSTDDTLQVARTLAALDHPVEVVVAQSNKGMGNALTAGVAAAQGSLLVLTADDLPFGFTDLASWDELENRPQVAIGSKAAKGSVVDRGLRRAALSRGFLLLRRVVLGMKTRDPQGTILLRGAGALVVAERVKEHGFLWTTEFVYLCERAGIAPVELAVALDEGHSEHASRVRVGDIVDMGTGLLRIRRRQHDEH